MPELADILRLHGPNYLAKYQDRLLPSHRGVMQDICACRTEGSRRSRVPVHSVPAGALQLPFLQEPTLPQVSKRLGGSLARRATRAFATGAVLHGSFHATRRAPVIDIIPVGSGEAALKYLAPYVFRVAISNKNILALEHGNVTFRHRDSQTHTIRTTTVTAEEFIRRFLQHVLSRGFQTLRTYGFLNPKLRHLLSIVRGQCSPGSPGAAHCSV